MPGYNLNGIIENDAGDEDYSDFSESLDPAYMVIPTSAKAYAGVAKHVDMVRQLPVHISKCILSYLDKTSLMNALLVSSCWRVLVEEVHRDTYVNQQLWEEVMLMQVTYPRVVYYLRLLVSLYNSLDCSWSMLL